MKASVIGGGSWGSAFALHLGRSGITTRLWIREPDILEEIERSRENTTFLPGYIFPETVTFSHDLEKTVQISEIVFIAVPSKFCRGVYTELAPFLNSGQLIVSLTKGIEENTLLRMSEVMRDIFSPRFDPKIAVLSGPSFAKEVAESHPTAVVVASEEINIAREIQQIISNSIFRTYTSTDITGVELSGAIKNVIAIAAGISDGLLFGYNTRAALITRGIAEITRLGIKMGARIETFSGLAGVGDLVLTCTGQLSRNHRVGEELGKSRPLDEIVSNMKMIAEGVTTTHSIKQLTEKIDTEAPICDQVYRVLYEETDPRSALQELMSRKLKDEFYI